MRQVVILFAIISGITADAAARRAGSDENSTVQPAVRACAVLTRDLVAPFSENPKMLDLVPPNEEALGTAGTACHYGSVRLQLFPGRGGKRAPYVKDLQPVSGVGDGGYFRSNRDRYADLMVWTARHSLDLQVSVPSGKTAEAIKADVVALANKIIAKLP